MNAQEIRERQLQPVHEIDEETIECGLRRSTRAMLEMERDKNRQLVATIDTLKWVIKCLIEARFDHE